MVSKFYIHNDILQRWISFKFLSIPITDRLTIVFLVGASVKSTLQRYWPASEPRTSCTRRIAGNVSGLNCARGPSHFSSDHTSEVANDRPPPPLPINPGFPTSILKRNECQIYCFYSPASTFFKRRPLKDLPKINKLKDTWKYQQIAVLKS